uniref:interleukin-6 receptor subunit beta-like n=1 Tax=Pristiophorus japonicus TaxID=55135 RepID=UPI00398E402F
MLITENTISAWVIVSISAFIIEGGLSMLCHDVDSTSEVVKLRSAVSLSCALREECIESLDANASQIFWKLNDTIIPREQYYFNATISRVTLKHFDAVKGYLTCHIDIKGAPNILHRFAVEAGLPPDKPKNISCISYWEKNFTCFWDQGQETYIETNFTLTRIFKKVRNDTCVNLKKNTCTFIYPNLYMAGKLTIIVMAQNALGKVRSDPLHLDVWHTWKTAPPQNVTVHSILGQGKSLLVTWHKPTNQPPNFALRYNIQYQMVGTRKWIQVAEKEEIINTSFVLKNLQPFTNYTVAVRCIGQQQIYWSDWSSKKTGLTSKAKPLTGPALWRQITNPDSQGNREVHLLWKALNRSKANGIILGYRVRCEKRREMTVMQQHNTTSLNYSLSLTHEAYVITVVAYNSVGDSPKATLIIPAINQTDLTAVEYVRITPQNNQLLTQWKTQRPPDNGYVIEWCLFLDTNPCAGPLHWQHEYNTEMAYLQGDFKPFACYNISVYAVYSDGPGNPFSILAYLQQSYPSEGPADVTQVVRGTEATIKWHEIPVEKRHGFITNYTIFYKSAKGENAVTVNSTIHEYTLKSLQKNTEYTVYVMASTEKGGTNSTLTFFTTNAIEQGDTMVIVMPVLFCFLLIVIVWVICLNNKHRIKKRIWPDVADPASSSVTDWLHKQQSQNDQTPKILNPGNDLNSDFSTVEVLYLSDEDKLHSVRKEKTSFLHTADIECSFAVTSPQQNTSNGAKTKLLQSMDKVMYMVLEEGYKSQVPDISRSLSKQPLLSNNLEKSTSDQGIGINTFDGAEDWYPQNIDENDVFQLIIKTNPYLKNSLNVIELQNAPGLDSINDPGFDSGCQVDMATQEDTGTLHLNPQNVQQDKQIDSPVQTYITLELLGFKLNNGI